MRVGIPLPKVARRVRTVRYFRSSRRPALVKRIAGTVERDVPADIRTRAAPQESGTMTAQYLRNISLVVADASGNGLDFRNFRCSFQVRRGDFQTPNSLDARIYNLSSNTANKVASSEFTQLALSVGYQGETEANAGAPTQLIFRGTIKQFRIGRLNQTDSYVDLTAADGDHAYNFAPVFISLPAGSNQNQIANLLAAALASHGGNQTISLGYVPDFPAGGLIRGKVLYGLARDHCRKFGNDNNCKFSIQDGALTFIPLSSYIPSGGSIPVIGVATGLIGVPEQTQQGIRIRTLLNPVIKIGQLIKLDASVNQLRYGLDTNAQISNPSLASSTAPNAQGLYYVMSADHVGDTRGQDWYSELTCLSVDATVPLNSEAISNPFAVGQVPIQVYGQGP
jgi:hypothetical protein